MERDARGYFTEEFRRWAVAAIEAGEMNSSELSSQYGIRGHSTILKWCRRYGGGRYPIMGHGTRDAAELSKEQKQVQILRNQVKSLERELKDSRLRQATLETLIDIAEQQYSIPIKKNSGGKLSNR
jgi:transposase